MTTVYQAIRAAQNAIVCPILAANNYVLGSAGSFIPGLNVPALTAIKGLRRLYGCPTGGDVDPPPPEFTGGQCAGVGYIVNVAGQANPPGGPGIADRTGTGPVQGMCFQDAGFGNVQIGVRFAEGCVVSGGGQATTVPSVQGTWGITSITRIDGQPDNCGSPPPVYPPPVNFTTNTEITYNIDDGTEVTVTVPFVYAPITANFDGSLRIPFTFELGGLQFTGNIDLGAELNVTINPPALPPGSGQETEDLPPGDPEDDVEPLPLDQKIIGVAVSSSIVGEQQLTTIAAQGMPNILAPRAGSIKFAYSLGVATFWSSDIDVKTDRTFIPCPFSQGADAVVVSPAPGVAVQWVPIKGYALATTRDVQGSSSAL